MPALDMRHPLRMVCRSGTSVSAALLVAALALASAEVAQAAGPGSPDSSFGSGGVVTVSKGAQLFGVAVQSDGETVVAGQSNGHVLVQRLTLGGRIDATFTGPSGYARAVAIQSDGKIVVAGSSGGALYVQRLTSALRTDSSFGSGGTATALGGAASVANGVAIGPDGSIIAAGSTTSTFGGGTIAAAVRFSAAGKLDWSQRLNFGANSLAQAVTVQPGDGKIVLVGSQRPLQVVNAVVARLNTSGSLDSSFASGGALTYHLAGGGYTALTSVVLAGNGQIVAGGVAIADTSNALFLRVNPGGSLAGSTIRPSGQNVAVLGDPIGVYGVGIAGGGRIVGAGNFENTGVEVDAALYALSAGGAPETSFGTGGTVRSPMGAFEACALAVAPDGSLVTVGDSVGRFPDARPCSTNPGPTGFVARYTGFGGSTGGLNVSLNGVPGTSKTSTVVSRGLKLGVSCNRACTIKGSLVTSSATAKQLRIRTTSKRCTTVKGKKRCKTTRGYLPVTIASARGALRGSGTATITLRLNKAYVPALKRQRSVSVTLQVSATSTTTHNGQTITRSLTFRR